MPKDLIRRLVLLDAALILLGFIVIGATAGSSNDLDSGFAEFAVAHGEAYELSTDANLVGYVLALLAYVVGWVGLWRHRQWGVLAYGAGVLLAVLAPVFEASTITYGKTLETAWEASSMVVSGLLIGVAAIRLGSARRSAVASPVAQEPAAGTAVAPPSVVSNVAPLISQPNVAPGSAPVVRKSAVGIIRDLAILGGLGGLAVSLIILKWHRNAGTTTGEAPGWTLLTGLAIGAVVGGVVAIILTAVEKNLAAKARSR
jgi:hypothetical protein